MTPPSYERGNWRDGMGSLPKGDPAASDVDGVRDEPATGQRTTEVHPGRTSQRARPRQTAAPRSTEERIDLQIRPSGTSCHEAPTAVVVKVLRENETSLAVARRLGAKPSGMGPSDAGGTFLINVIELTG